MWSVGASGQFSVYVFLVLVTVVVASVTMFWWLAVRWTVRRNWAALNEWARTRGMTVQSVDDGTTPSIELPSVLSDLAPLGPTVRVLITDGKRTLVSLVTPTTPHSREVASPSNWHVLLYKLEVAWPPTALRPAANAVSLVDLLPLTSFPSLTNSERFVVFGTESVAAKRIAGSSIRALLPPDTGMMLLGQFMVFDFSARPFDPIEFGRAIALAEQMTTFLPANV